MHFIPALIIIAFEKGDIIVQLLIMFTMLICFLDIELSFSYVIIEILWIISFAFILFYCLS